MQENNTLEQAKKDQAAGKSPSTQAGRVLLEKRCTTFAKRARGLPWLLPKKERPQQKCGVRLQRDLRKAREGPSARCSHAVSVALKREP